MYEMNLTSGAEYFAQARKSVWGRFGYCSENEDIQVLVELHVHMLEITVNSLMFARDLFGEFREYKYPQTWFMFTEIINKTWANRKY